MYKRPHHQRIAQLLEAFDAQLLFDTQCFFGGGTAIALLLDEYRVSVDVDFICASPDGYRRLRNIVTQDSLGALLKQPVPHLREVRADRYGIRTFLAIDDTPIKVEIVSEGRVPVSGVRDPILPVPYLSREDMVAEKLLANTDRGLDRSTFSRDMIDIAMMVRQWGDIPKSAWDKARAAYGESVTKLFRSSLMLIEEPAYLGKCLDQMSMDKALLQEIPSIVRAQLFDALSARLTQDYASTPTEDGLAEIDALAAEMRKRP